MMFKKKLIYITLLFLFQHSLFYSQLSALDFDKNQGYWSVGAQYGSAYQWSDVDSRSGGWGTSLTLGKNLFYDEFALLSLDMRSRLFFGVSEGLDATPIVNIEGNEVLNGTQEFNYLANPGYFFHNYKTSLLGLDIEPSLTFNKFRADDRWFVSLYGGAGLAAFSSRMDLSDTDGNYGNRFASIDQSASRSDIKKELKQILDGKYESRADGFVDRALKFGFMPSIGVELGYDLTDYLTAFLGHRTQFSRTDHLDGVDYSDPDSDLLNYTHIGLQVNFSKRFKRVRSSNIGVNTSNPARFPGYDEEAPPHGYPIVKISYPEIDWFNTSKSEMEVVADLENVYSVLDISCMVNGKEVAFDYNKDQVKFYAYFQRGTNVLKVQVRNDKGEARDIKRVIYSPVEENGNIEEKYEENRPAIELISPEELNYYAEEDIIDIQAFIENVDVKDDIKLSANGMDLNTFKFDPNLGILSLKVRLAKGTNTFLLTAYNAYGKMEQEFKIFYGVDPESEIVVDENEEDVLPPAEQNDYPPLESNTKPTVSILSPKTNPFYTNTDKVFFQAETHGVSTKQDITFLINGVQNYFFDFDKSNKIVSDEIHLMTPETKIKIQTKNEYGTAESTLMIIYGDPPGIETEPVKKKIIANVDVTQPDEYCQSDFLVSFNEPVKKSDIQIRMNDFELRNYRYAEAERELKFSLYLDEGNNDIVIAVGVDDRSEQARINLNCGDGSVGKVILDDEPVVDTSPASLDQLLPADQFTTEEQDIILRFKASNVRSKEGVMIFVNDEIINDFEFDPNTGEVRALISLLPNENEIIVRISNDYGTDEATRMYFYDEPFRSPPSVVINSPRNGFSTDENSMIFRASVDFIKSIDDVEVFLNDKALTDYSYNEEFGKIQAIIPVRLGKNTIEVIASNKLGTNSEKVTFSYRMEYVPAVQILGPKEGLEYRKSFAMLSGIVQNMKSKQGIGIQINRKPFLAINYDENEEMVSARLLLEKGNNEIILSAKNDFGFASDTINIFFRGAPEKPTIQFIQPAKDGTIVSNALFNLEAAVTEINHSINVDLTVNGRIIDEVYYFKEEKVVRAEFNLKKGRNDIKLSATNDTGQTSESTTVYLQ